MAMKTDFSHLSGYWKGWFGYGPQYSSQFQRQRDRFMMELEFKDQSLEGYCHDPITEKYFNSPARIKGIFKENKITFLKTYAARVELDELDETYVAYDQASYEIFYHGFYNNNRYAINHRFAGKWEIEGIYVLPSGHIETGMSRGMWEMRKLKRLWTFGGLV